MTEMKREYGTLVLAVVLVLLLYAVSSFFAWSPLAVWTALLSILSGGFLMAFGFWGADYAMSVALGELDQSKQPNGKIGKVYVPFLRNYTPTEWWNLNWLIVTLGVILACSGFLIVGIHLHSWL